MYLQQFGISQDQITSLTSDLATFLKGFAGDVVPVASGLLGIVFNALIVGIVSIYLVLDGGRFLHWATGNTPLSHRRTGSFFIQSLDRVMGGYIRGQLLLCLDLDPDWRWQWVIGVPFPLVLAVLAFVLNSSR